MPNYARNLTRLYQRTPLWNRDQIKNRAGGYVFKIDPFDALDRFLILGCESGTYYAGAREMTREAADLILACASIDPCRTIGAIVDASCNNRAIKNDPAIFALALLAGSVKVADPHVCHASLLALNQLSKVCRIGTHLFSFVDQVTQFRGWGRSLRRAVADWYTNKDPHVLLYQVTKYQQRNGWSHRDLLRLSHPKSDKLDPLFKYIVSDDPFDDKVQTLNGSLLGYIGAIETVKKASNKQLVLKMIRDYGLVREHIPTNWLNDSDIWAALLEKMPYTALLRNLGKMSAVGLIKPLSEASKTICNRLRESQYLRRARVHPFAILLAQTTYAAGRGVRGRLQWPVDQNVVDALEDAFYNAFETVEPAGKNFMLGIDVSGSMGWRGWSHMGSIAGTHIKAYQAAAVMAMVQIKTEPWCFTAAFSGNNWSSPAIRPVSLSRKRRLDSVLDELKRIPVGPTDCALPMIYAAENKLEVDTFVIYTDNETWCGDIHPSQALEDYRQKMGRDAKLISCGMTATNYSIADPNDPDMLDVVGFDGTCPKVISEFARGLDSMTNILLKGENEFILT
jgi:60 kDa SS-A/Ro ribonucleoprotein